MDDEPDDHVLRVLQSIEKKIDDLQKDVSFVKDRMVFLENHANSNQREIRLAEEVLSLQNVRLDFIDSKLGRIMRRLNLLDETTAPPGKTEAKTEKRRNTSPTD